jgi:hypothetical protein
LASMPVLWWIERARRKREVAESGEKERLIDAGVKRYDGAMVA